MGKYKSRSEIVHQILASAKDLDGVTKTRIMFKAYLSFAQMKDYLEFLIHSGLLEHVPERGTYRTTEKGLALIETYSKMNELMREAHES